jgi:hypothetical protein
LETTTLVATTTWDDLACGGSRQDVQHSWALPVQYNVKDGISDFLGILVYNGDFCVSVKQHGDIGLQCWFKCLIVFGSRAPLLTILMATLEMNPERGVLWRAWRGRQHTSERGSPTTDAVRPHVVLSLGFDALSLCLGGGRCCSKFVVTGPAWRWSS